MNRAEFQSFAAQNVILFAGVHPETPMSIQEAERRLGCELPLSLKWLLTHWGYSDICGVDSLDLTVETTIRARAVEKLPARYVILNDWQDAGVVILDTLVRDAEGESPIFWTGYHNLAALRHGQEMDVDVDWFDNSPAWVLARMAVMAEE